MRARGEGQVINISSAGVQMRTPRFSGYIASKAALEAFSDAVQAESLSDGIRFTTISMPLVRTPMISPTEHYDGMPALTPTKPAGWSSRPSSADPAASPLRSPTSSRPSTRSAPRRWTRSAAASTSSSGVGRQPRPNAPLRVRFGRVARDFGGRIGVIAIRVDLLGEGVTGRVMGRRGPECLPLGGITPTCGQNPAQ